MKELTQNFDSLEFKEAPAQSEQSNENEEKIKLDFSSEKGF